MAVLYSTCKVPLQINRGVVGTVSVRDDLFRRMLRLSACFGRRDGPCNPISPFSPAC